MVEAMRGKVSVSSSEGKGSTFTVSLVQAGPKGVDVEAVEGRVAG
jgi:signal transduction histidine kinase